MVILTASVTSGREVVVTSPSEVFRELNVADVTSVLLADRPQGYIIKREDFPVCGVRIINRTVVLKGIGPGTPYVDGGQVADAVCVSRGGFLDQRNLRVDDCFMNEAPFSCFASVSNNGRVGMEDMELSDSRCVETRTSPGIVTILEMVRYVTLGIGGALGSGGEAGEVLRAARQPGTSRVRVADSGWVNFPAGSSWRMRNVTLSCTAGMTARHPLPADPDRLVPVGPTLFAYVAIAIVAALAAAAGTLVVVLTLAVRSRAAAARARALPRVHATHPPREARGGAPEPPTLALPPPARALRPPARAAWMGAQPPRDRRLVAGGLVLRSRRRQRGGSSREAGRSRSEPAALEPSASSRQPPRREPPVPPTAPLAPPLPPARPLGAGGGERRSGEDGITLPPRSRRSSDPVRSSDSTLGPSPPQQAKPPAACARPSSEAPPSTPTTVVDQLGSALASLSLNGTPQVGGANPSTRPSSPASPPTGRAVLRHRESNPDEDEAGDDVETDAPACFSPNPQLASAFSLLPLEFPSSRPSSAELAGWPRLASSCTTETSTGPSCGSHDGSDEKKGCVLAPANRPAGAATSAEPPEPGPARAPGGARAGGASGGDGDLPETGSSGSGSDVLGVRRTEPPRPRAASPRHHRASLPSLPPHPALTFFPEGFPEGRLAFEAGYRLGMQLGRGHFGCVYLAERLPPHSGTVAIKVLHAHDLAQVAKAEAEIASIRAVNHPNCVRLLDSYHAPLSVTLQRGRGVVSHAPAGGADRGRAPTDPGAVDRRHPPLGGPASPADARPSLRPASSPSPGAAAAAPSAPVPAPGARTSSPRHAPSSLLAASDSGYLQAVEEASHGPIRGAVRGEGELGGAGPGGRDVPFPPGQPPFSHGARGTVQFHLVMEHCDSGTLEDGVRAGWFRDPDGTPRLRDVLATALDITRGLACLHSHGREKIVHRDLSLGNVLLKSTPAGVEGLASEGEVGPEAASRTPAPADLAGARSLTSAEDRRGFRALVSDFGLATTLDSQGTHRSSEMRGTVAFMPPEALLARKISPSLDIYSLGILIFCMYAGESPYRRLSTPQIIALRTRDGGRWDLPPPPGSTPALARLFSDLTHHDRHARPTATQVVARIEALLADIDAEVGR